MYMSLRFYGQNLQQKAKLHFLYNFIFKNAVCLFISSG